MNVSRRRYMGANGGSSPYQRIEYLEGTGTQYIDTGIGTLDQLDIFISVYVIIKSGAYMGVFGNALTTQQSYIACRLLNKTNYLQILFPNANITSQSLTLETWLNIQYHCWSGDNYVIFNDTKIATSTDNIKEDSNSKILLFGYNGQANRLSGRISSFAIKQNDSLIIDLVPVRVGQVGYMYDTVSGELFGNLGTGDFILGQDIN